MIVIALITVFMGFQATHVQLSYELIKMLPASDSTDIEYQQFKKKFGEDGNVMVVGVKDPKLFTLAVYKDWYDLNQKLRKIEGVEEVLSSARIFQLNKNDSLSSFELKPLVKHSPETQGELDTILSSIKSMPFYRGFLFGEESDAQLMMITLNKVKINTVNRVALVMNIKSLVEEFSKKHVVDVHYSGLPYIRTIFSKKIEDELKYFVGLAMIITSILLFLFFRSFKAIILPMFIIIISLIWAFGTMALFGYKITILSGIIPPLLILIGVENCIYIINKYHLEYKSHGDKKKSLSLTLEKMGTLTLLTNATTASGFITFAFTSSAVLIEFGIIASLNIMLEYILTLVLIPILYSYFPAPKKRHIRQLDNRFLLKGISKATNIVLHHRKLSYTVFITLTFIGIYGFTLLTTTGSLVDDVPHKDALYKDLQFVESNFKGIMPFEVSIDTKKKNGVMKLSVIQKIDKVQKIILSYPEFSRPLSLAEFVKQATQAFYNGDSSSYRLPTNEEQAFVFSYIPRKKGNENLLRAFLDSNKQVTRISVQMKNIGTPEIRRIKESIKPRIDSVFSPDKYDVKLTGSSVVFLKGTEYLVDNLLISILIAIVVISLLTAWIFKSIRWVIAILIANLFPQLLTAAMMGFLGIPLKPSTLLIFSIAYGISVDNAISFMLKYYQDIKHKKATVLQTVKETLYDRGSSMIISSFVLFLGFAIFIASQFGGTIALGALVSFTLFTALFANIILLPSLVISFHTKKEKL